jgi:hypothetical protein
LVIAMMALGRGCGRNSVGNYPGLARCVQAGGVDGNMILKSLCITRANVEIRRGVV